MENPGAPLFDKKMIYVALFVFLSLMGWQYYLHQKYPHLYDGSSTGNVANTDAVSSATPESAKTESNNETGGAKAGNGNGSVSPESLAGLQPAEVLQEEKTKFQDSIWSFEVSNFGMGIRNLTLHTHTDRENRSIQLGLSNAINFETRLVGSNRPLVFTMERLQPNVFRGIAQTPDYSIEKRIEIDSENFLLKTKISVKGSIDRFPGFIVSMKDNLNTNLKSHFLFPSFDFQEFYHSGDGKSERVHVSTTEQVIKTFDRAKVGTIGSQYFSLALVDKSNVVPEFRAETKPSELLGEFIYRNKGASGSQLNFEYIGFAGPKSLKVLELADENLPQIINFGFFSWIAKKILWLMKMFNTVLGNWGLSIVFLTILVRLMVLPFALMSFKSMKGMQALQPKMQEIRERLKENPQQMNLEIMNLMREQKVNPLGGCLPMLLQFPVFIALYQVLGNSIELYKAPFFFWIHDLSLKDPFYIFPVLMGIAMFIQQKITPSTMDPTQAKIMLVLPVVFSVLMFTLPSGLTLYILVSTLFAIFQQMYFLREKPEEIINSKTKGATV